MNEERRARREYLVGALLPFFLTRFHSRGQGEDTETLARSQAFDLADRVMADSDKRERNGA